MSPLTSGKAVEGKCGHRGTISTNIQAELAFSQPIRKHELHFGRAMIAKHGVFK